MTTFNYEQLQEEYEKLWAGMAVNTAVAASATFVAQKLLTYKARYKAVSDVTGVPTALIMAIHQRENPLFTAYLGNGDPLSHITIHVPAGRGPFHTWEDGAIDALKYQGLDKVTDWSMAKAAYCAEKFNGFGYRLYHSNTKSPYLWAGSNQYKSGKYVADGKWDQYAVDRQLGVMVILQAIMRLDPTLRLAGYTTIPVIPPKAPQDPVGAATGGAAVVVAAGAIAATSGLPWPFIAIGVVVVAAALFALWKVFKK